MFGQDHFGRPRMMLSGKQIVTFVLSILTVVVSVYIFININWITVKIAIGIVNLLTAGVPILFFLIAIALIFSRRRWRNRRGFW